MTIRRLPALAVAILAIGVFATGCATPDEKKQRHLERGDAYSREKRDEFAVIEYTSALRIDPKFGPAHLKLAETYDRMNNVRAAYPEYIRAADALPDDRAVQLKAIEVLLLGRRFDDAETRAAKLLAKSPEDVDALIYRANAMAGLNNPDAAVKEIEEALRLQPNDTRAYLQLGAIRVKSGQGAKAEAAFKQAIAVAPQSIPPHLAFANYLWSNGRQAESEDELHRALAIGPKNLLANRMMAMLYMATGRSAQAEQPLKTIAEVSQLPMARFQLAEYYVDARRPADAKNLLQQLASDPSTSADAERMLASIEYDAKDQAAAHKRLDKLIAAAPTDARALILKARWLGSEKKVDQALDRARAATTADPQSATAFFTLGQIHDMRRELTDASKAYTQALQLNPRLAAAQVALSRLNLLDGKRDVALNLAEEAKTLEPANAAPRLALVRSLLDARDVKRAETEVAALLRGWPRLAEAHAVNGTLQFHKRNVAAAQSAYEQALQLEPGNIEAITGLAALDVQARKLPAAIERLDTAIAAQPDRPELLSIAARLYIEAGQHDKAERALRQAVAVDPRFWTGYGMLAQLYLKQNRIDEARREFEGMTKRNPSAVGPRTMVGILLETQGKRAEARKWYEATVADIANAAVAANNLAYIYAEEGTNLDVALQLASSAKAQMPDNAEIDDTLGWVYYKKDLPALAIAPLEASLKKMPNSAGILYHLGLVYAKLGDKARAREALERALKLDPAFPAAATARKTLTDLES